MTIVLIQAATVVERSPHKYWRPSNEVLASLRPRTEVQLRVVDYNPDRPTYLEDSEPIWVRLTEASASDYSGQITVSAMDADGFRVGDGIRFTADRIFEIAEWDEKGELIPNLEKAAFVLNKDVVVGLTYLHNDGSLEKQVQFHGTVEAANLAEGIRIRRSGRGDLFRLPPDFRSLQPARPGTYTLRSTGDVIEDPDLECRWTITAPASRPESADDTDDAGWQPG